MTAEFHFRPRELPTHCPKCGADLTGSKIPEEDREFFGGATNYGRVIGVYDTERDRTVAWQCPDCGHIWERKQ